MLMVKKKQQMIKKKIRMFLENSESTIYIEFIWFSYEASHTLNRRVKRIHKNLTSVYTKNLDYDQLMIELDQFIQLLKWQPAGKFAVEKDEKGNNIKDDTLIPLRVLTSVESEGYTEVFPDSYIMYCIFLIVPLSITEAERSFSVLKRIKNVLRSTMHVDRLNS